jgi:hypothetical protein
VYLKAIDRILWLTYGNHGSSKEKREDAKVILEALSNGRVVSRSELMRHIGLDEDSSDDVDEFNSVVRPLKGRNSSNPLDMVFVVSEKDDGEVLYRLSRGAFEASLLKLKSDVLDLFERYEGGEVPIHKVLDQVIWLSYANHSNTYDHRMNARKALRHLIEDGKTSKEELMSLLGFEYGDENDDQSFRGMMKYLRASWKDEEDAKNPLHTDNHGFLVRQEMKGQTAYYSLCPREFKRTMNVVAANIRSFL